MRHKVLIVLSFSALVGLTLLTACQHGQPKAPPPPPPAAPATPPPAPPPPPSEGVAKQPDEYARIRGMDSEEINRTGLLAEIHYDFDKSDLREGDRQILAKNADALKKFDFLRVTVEGHCDERGTTDYNMALGDRRARVAHDYLVSLGVAADRLKTVSYGKEIPLCDEHNEECWARNRRAHFTVTGKTAGR